VVPQRVRQHTVEEDYEVSLRCRTFYRYMSRAEAEAVERTGLLRGGSPGEVYWTEDLYEHSTEAMGRLALADLPEVRMRFRIKGEPSLVRNGTRVRPDGRQPGGGTEYMTLARVEVEVLAVDNLE
jgi:hypothetical protein